MNKRLYISRITVMLRDRIHALETGAEKGEGFPVFEAGKARGTGGEKGEKGGVRRK